MISHTFQYMLGQVNYNHIVYVIWLKGGSNSKITYIEFNPSKIIYVKILNQPLQYKPNFVQHFSA